MTLKINYYMRLLLSFSVSLFVILVTLKVKLYFSFDSYIFSSGLLQDLASILFFDLAFVLFFGLIVYLLVRTLKYSGIILSAVFYTLLIVFSTVSTITYLRLGSPVNISMVPEMKFDFLKSSIEQTADIRLLLIKIVLLIVFGLLLPYLINVISKRFLRTFTLSVIISTAVCFALFLTTYV